MLNLIIDHTFGDLTIILIISQVQMEAVTSAIAQIVSSICKKTFKFE